MNKLTLALLVALSAVGCTTVEIQRLPSENEMTMAKLTDEQKNKVKKIKGARFNRPAFYFVIGANANGTCQGSIITLPDASETYVASVKAWPFTSSSFQLSLADGWNLTGVNSSLDSTAIASTIAGLFGGSGGGGGDGGMTPSMVDPSRGQTGGSQAALEPGIYKLSFDIKGDGSLTELKSPVIGFGGKCSAIAYGKTDTSGDGQGAGAKTDPPKATK